MNDFLLGASALACVTVGLFFLRFWRRTRDRLFVLFALAFWTLAMERVVLFALAPDFETRPYVYMVRLLAFGLIILGIIDKNRSG